MAVGDVNPVLSKKTIYYDVATGETKLSSGLGKRWYDEDKACVEPAPATGGPYARRGDEWVSMDGIVAVET